MDKPEFRHKYTYEMWFGSEKHMWTCVGGRGGIHLSITVYKDKELEPSAGLEFHRKVSPDHPDDAPTHDVCWLLKTPCWHDGTSLYASEHFIPMWKAMPHNHEGIFLQLAGEYRRHFAELDEDGDCQ